MISAPVKKYFTYLRTKNPVKPFTGFVVKLVYYLVKKIA
jgi:hypothetical protein